MLARLAIRLVISFLLVFESYFSEGSCPRETSDQPIWIRVIRCIFLDLGPELGAEGLFQGRNDAVSELGSVRVGERPLRRLEGGREGDRLLPWGDLHTAVDVEGAQLTQLWSGSLASSCDELPRCHGIRNDKGEILAHGRIRDDVLVDDQLRDPSDECVDVELERAPFAGQVGLAH